MSERGHRFAEAAEIALTGQFGERLHVVLIQDHLLTDRLARQRLHQRRYLVAPLGERRDVYPGEPAAELGPELATRDVVVDRSEKQAHLQVWWWTESSKNVASAGILLPPM